jgi:hypothetical protein
VLVLLMIASTLTLCRVHGQQPSGSLSGRLTDAHSSPLQNITVTLRNVTTGAAVTSTTLRGGKYSFQDLAQGEYTLAASGPMGTGEVGGIIISPGHESRVQAVIDFAADNPRRAQMATLNRQRAEKTALRPDTHELLTRVLNASMPASRTLVVDTSIASEDLTRLALTTSDAKTFLPPNAVLIASTTAAGVAPPELAMVEVVALDGAFFAQGRSDPHAHGVAAPIEVAERGPETLDSEQLESLPIANRDWRAFLLDRRALPTGDKDETEGPKSPASEISLDGQPIRSAFGSVISGRTAGLVSTGETAIREVRSIEAGNSLIPRSGHNFTNIETRQGTEHLHGQVFLFDRQHVLGARNPFTQWVRETSPASGPAVPRFTAEPYTPPDVELRWGIGAGGVLRRPKLFWFGALDGYERNNPAISTVRHPDSFFAQPANDQMQLLSAQLGLSSVDPVAAGVGAYSKLLESLAGLLGPAPRSSLQLTGFERLDWSAAERQRFTVEATGNRLNAPGGEATRASQMYGTHSLGVVHASNDWLLGRWEAFISPNLLAVTQGSFGRQIHTAPAGKPSAFEQSLNISSWGQLPQIVVGSGDGLTIGNPARIGRGNYPDEKVYTAQEQLKWIHGKALFNTGFELSHNNDATSRLRNQTGTYYYSSVEDFASDALAFFAYGLNGQLNPMDQHNCDQRGRPWRDTAGTLHGLGYLPCYSYYSQTMGSSDWWLSTNDWAAYATSQWQPSKRTVFTLAMRWDLEQLPPPIRLLDNPDLLLTQRLPRLGSQWGPRGGFAWGTGESRWPVIRLGYGMYFSRTPNAVVEAALTQTGSPHGDLNFFMRPTDNLHGGGAPPFPYVLAGEPGIGVKPGAVEFAPAFQNGEVHQAEISIEERLPSRIHLEASAVTSLGRRLPVSFDANIDPAMNPKTITYTVVDGNGSGPIKAPQITVPFFASWPSLTSGSGYAGRLNSNYQQVSEVSSRANSTYEALLLRLSRSARGLTFRGRYTFGYASDWNPDEGVQISGPSVLDPSDFRQEYGTSSLDIRHSATAAVILQPRWKLQEFAGYALNGWMLSGVGYFHSGLPYSMRTAGSLAKEFDVNGTAIVALSTGMNGYGGDNRVYGIARNTYRHPATWKADMRIAKRFNLGQMRQLELMAESFNLFNHQNVTQVETVGYSIEQGTLNGAMPRLNFLTGLKSGQKEFGKPLNINATDLYRERQFQFGARMRF